MLSKLATSEGFSASRLPGVRFMKSTEFHPRSPVSYTPSIVLIAQGGKTGFLGGKTFRYDANNYLVLAAPLPFECETMASAEEPLYGVSIGVTPALVGELVLQMKLPPAPSSAPVEAIQARLLQGKLSEAVVRLVDALGCDEQSRILGPQIVREIIYHVLKEEEPITLRALAAPDSHFGQITRALNRIHAEYAEPLDMPTLATEAGMSVSAFHARFKAITASPPLQYLKAVRLHKARTLMIHDGASASWAAREVGYESASQFSREFKRFFGEGPAAAAGKLRASLSVVS
ncbi:MAG: AraC family transcriptional regulator [Akkermansiaceae bacterium]|nr:AraC family transcriptional regulator [Akkermansiaceae bacterium]